MSTIGMDGTNGGSAVRMDAAEADMEAVADFLSQVPLRKFLYVFLTTSASVHMMTMLALVLEGVMIIGYVIHRYLFPLARAGGGGGVGVAGGTRPNGPEVRAAKEHLISFASGRMLFLMANLAGSASKFSHGHPHAAAAMHTYGGMDAQSNASDSDSSLHFTHSTPLAPGSGADHDLILWILWYILIGFLRWFLVMLRERFTHAQASIHEVTIKNFVKLALATAVFATVNIGIGLGVLSLALRARAPWSVMSLFLFENVVLISSFIKLLYKFHLYIRSLRLDQPWEERGSSMFYVDSVCDVIAHSVTGAHFIHVWSLFGLSFSLLDLLFFLNVRAVLINIYRSVRGMIVYARAMHQINSRFPDATAEELRRLDDICSICRDGMEEAKKLPCNHLFHRVCLQQWMEHQSFCPSCRAPIIRPNQQPSANQQQQQPQQQQQQHQEQAQHPHGVGQMRLANVPAHMLPPIPPGVQPPAAADPYGYPGVIGRSGSGSGSGHVVNVSTHVHARPAAAVRDGPQTVMSSMQSQSGAHTLPGPFVGRGLALNDMTPTTSASMHSTGLRNRFAPSTLRPYSQPFIPIQPSSSSSTSSASSSTSSSSSSSSSSTAHDRHRGPGEPHGQIGPNAGANSSFETHSLFSFDSANSRFIPHWLPTFSLQVQSIHQRQQAQGQGQGQGQGQAHRQGLQPHTHMDAAHTASSTSSSAAAAVSSSSFSVHATDDRAMGRDGGESLEGMDETGEEREKDASLMNLDPTTTSSSSSSSASSSSASSSSSPLQGMSQRDRIFQAIQRRLEHHDDRTSSMAASTESSQALNSDSTLPDTAQISSASSSSSSSSSVQVGGGATSTSHSLASAHSPSPTTLSPPLISQDEADHNLARQLQYEEQLLAEEERQHRANGHGAGPTSAFTRLFGAL